jgi:hypothetical protein
MAKINIERIKSDNGSRIEPSLNDEWSDLEKLHWKAAVTELEAGFPIEVLPGSLSTWSKVLRGWVPQRDAYDVLLAGSTIGLRGFQSVWSFLNGVESGANAASYHGRL